MDLTGCSIAAGSSRNKDDKDTGQKDYVEAALNKEH